MNMHDWVEKLDAFLQFNGYEILQDAGKVQRTAANILAESHYETFRIKQDKNFESDFDKTIKKLTKK